MTGFCHLPFRSLSHILHSPAYSLQSVLLPDREPRQPAEEGPTLMHPLIPPLLSPHTQAYPGQLAGRSAPWNGPGVDWLGCTVPGCAICLEPVCPCVKWLWWVILNLREEAECVLRTYSPYI